MDNIPPPIAESTSEDNLLKQIKIKMIKLDNIRVKNVPIHIEVKVQYGEKTLGKVSSLEVETSVIKINRLILIDININNHDELNKLASTPLEFIITEIQDKGRRSSKEEKNNFGGRCHLDLLPILMGETTIIDQPLLVEINSNCFGQDMLPWTCLPILYVDVEVDEPLIPKDVIEENNILSLTVESIYNLSQNFPQNSDFKAAVEIPLKDEIFETVIFNDGLYYAEKDPDNIKLWHGLPHPPGRNALTKYRISEDHHEIHNQTGKPLDFKILLSQNSPRLKWNTLKRMYLTKSATETFKKSLYLNNFWPIEFLAIINDEPKKGKGKQKVKENQIAMKHFISYLDLSSFTYPGLSRIRIASPVLPFNQDEFILKSRSEKPIFEVTVEKPDTPTSQGKKKKETQKKKLNEPNDTQSSIDSNMFVIIEMEFLHPIVEEPSLENLYERINEIITPLNELQLKLCSKKYSIESYKDCIKVMHGKLHEEYCNFMEDRKKHYEKHSQVFVTGQDILPEFTQYLINNSTYSLIKESLKSHVTDMFRQKYMMALKMHDENALMEETQNLYIKLIEEMHEALNSHKHGDPYVKSHNEHSNSDLQLYYALEALEEKRYDISKKWYLKRLDTSTRDAELWLDYGLYFLRISMIDDAMICIKKVLEISQKHCTGLLLYAILLTENQMYEKALVFFQSLTKIYNLFKEGWIAFNIYFVLTEDTVGQKQTQRIISKILSSSINSHIREYPAICWRDMDNLQSHYLQAASLFLKINAFKFAELALAKELALKQQIESISYIYYSAVLSYQKENFNEASDQLKKIVLVEKKNYVIWSLYGHVQYKLGMKKLALNVFTYISNYLDCPGDMHMLYLRMGFIYFEEGAYNSSIEMFMRACAHHPTPLSWFQVGVAAYEVGDYGSSELALSESNMLDKYSSETWGYLALVNLSMKRKEAFRFCYRQAKILYLDNQELEKRIDDAKKKLFKYDK